MLSLGIPAHPVKFNIWIISDGLQLKQRHHLLTKVCILKATVLPVQMCELDHKEG